MKKGSILTIVLLVLIIVALSAALVITNLPEKNVQNGNNPIENQQGSVLNETTPESPTFIALDSNMAKNMYKILNAETYLEPFHNFKTGEITIDDLSNEEIQTIAYNFYLLNNDDTDGRVSKTFIDENVKIIFGEDVEYKPTYIYIQNENTKLLEYLAEDDTYHENTGFGNGRRPLVYTAITQVAEYSDRYEVTEKMLYVTTSQDENGRDLNIIHSWFPVIGEQQIGSMDDIQIQNIKSDKELCTVDDETSKKLISTFYDKATEYKHTFKKNENGTYSWIKSEIIK